jgi:tetratricopeptide (TPR) repeat protein
MKKNQLLAMGAVCFVFICDLVVAAVPADTAGNSKQLFSEANRCYESQQYDQAILLYEQIIAGRETGACDVNVYFNLGNCYYRVNKMGKAILNYERAKRIKPRDEDISFNLSFVRSVINDPEETNILIHLYNMFSAGELTLITTFFYLLLCLSLTLTILGKVVFKHTGTINYTLVCVTVVFFVWSMSKISRENQPTAVVLVAPCEVRNGPGLDYTVGFSLTEGKKTVVLGEKDEWYAVGLQKEKLKGWAQKAVLEKI